MIFIFRPGEECKKERARWDGSEMVASGNFWGPRISSGYQGWLQSRNQESEVQPSWQIVLKDKKADSCTAERHWAAQGSGKSFWSLDRSSYPCSVTLGWPQWSVDLLIFSWASLLQYLLLNICRQEEHNIAINPKLNPAVFTGIHPSSLHWFSEKSLSHARGEVEHGARLSNTYSTAWGMLILLTMSFSQMSPIFTRWICWKSKSHCSSQARSHVFQGIYCSVWAAWKTHKNHNPDTENNIV